METSVDMAGSEEALELRHGSWKQPLKHGVRFSCIVRDSKAPGADEVSNLIDVLAEEESLL